MKHKLYISYSFFMILFYGYIKIHVVRQTKLNILNMNDNV